MILAFYSEASGTGKDTAADFAREALHRRGIACVRDAFANDGKVVCADALGIQGTREEKVAAIDKIKLNGYVLHRNGEREVRDGLPRIQGDAVSGRDFIIGLLGSPGKGNGIRGLAPHFWTQQVVKRARYSTGFTAISDMRFIEEAEGVKAVGGFIVEVARGENLGTFNEQRIPAEYIDHAIDNNGTLEQLREQVEKVIELVGERLAAVR